MATVTTKRLPQAKQHAAPYGNRFGQVFNFTTSAAGVAANTDLATAVQVNDVVRIGILPAGLEIHRGEAIISDAFAASTTADIGFLYVDGVDSATVPQSATYFHAVLSTSATSRTASNPSAPVRLPKDAYLVLTRKGAADSAAGVLDYLVTGELTGPA